jgi:hypothetical protein
LRGSGDVAPGNGGDEKKSGEYVGDPDARKHGKYG